MERRPFGKPRASKFSLEKLHDNALALLNDEILRWRQYQRTVKAESKKPDAEDAATYAMLSRTAACFLAEGRKGNKDTREKGKKLDKNSRGTAIAAYLRQLSDTERAEVLREANASVLNG